MKSKITPNTTRKEKEPCIKHKLGFFQLKNKPSKNDLEEYYLNKYYQQEHGNYRIKYTDEEIKYFYIKNEQKFKVASKLMASKSKRFLDIGCGEGYMMSFFKKINWNVLGLDYTNHACLKMNPDCFKAVKTGDIYESIDSLIKNKEKFEIISLINVLEHSLEPIELLIKIKSIAHDNTVLIITVPNDFSFYQNFLLNEHMIDKPFWIANPDHISYFQKDSLKNICNYTGWKEKIIIADFPIDIFLANPYSNYLNNKQKGVAAHRARVKLDNLFHSISVNATIDFYVAMASLGFGRQITGFYKIK